MTRRWLTRRWLTALLMTLSVVVAAQPAGGVDEVRAAWPFKREVVLPTNRDGGFVAVALPPEVASRSQPGLRDLRLLDAGGRETPFIVLDDIERRVEQRTTGSLVEARQERRDGSAWTVDFGRVVAFDRLVLNIPSGDFTKRLRLELSTDGTIWTPTGDDYWVFTRLWQQQAVHGTTLETPEASARFVRLTADDVRSRPIDLIGIEAVSSTGLAGSRWTEDVTLELISTAAGHSKYRVPVPAGFPVRRLSLDAADAAFARPVAVLEQHDGSEREVGRLLAYRFRLPETAADVEARDIDVAGLSGGTLVVDVTDGDNPPLAQPRARLSAPQTRLVTATTAPALTLYYGNAVTRPAVYDLERLRGSLTMVAAFPLATLGAETANPRYRAPAPLAFVSARGAAVEVGEWTYTRGFHISGADDIYSVTFAAADLAHVRAGLADLRVIDAANRQVPYVIEPVTDLARVPLTMTPAASPRGLARTSTFTLTAPVAAFPEPVPFTAIELEVAEGFFTREAVVLVPDPGAAGGYRVAGSGTLRSTLRDTPAGPVVTSIPVSAIATTLTVEITDGDNAPLTLRTATGLAAVPRLTFKAGPGEYRLLFGNDRVPPPSYELGLLREEVLAYSALPIAPADLQPSVANPEHTRALAEMMRQAPPTVVLWSALGLAVVVLLALTRRILAAGPPQPPDHTP